MPLQRHFTFHCNILPYILQAERGYDRRWLNGMTVKEFWKSTTQWYQTLKREQ